MARWPGPTVLRCIGGALANCVTSENKSIKHRLGAAPRRDQGDAKRESHALQDIEALRAEVRAIEMCQELATGPLSLDDVARYVHEEVARRSEPAPPCDI